MISAIYILTSLYLAASSIMPVSQLRPGMRGYGLTVFKGDRVEKFSVRVVGVLPRALYDQDLILIYCDDPKLMDSGVVAGMSGSPIFINDRFIGGLGYGYSFSKGPYALVTPAEAMASFLDKAGQPADPWRRSTKVPPLGVKNPLIMKPLEGSVVKPLAVPLISSLPESMTYRLFPFLKDMGTVIPAGGGLPAGQKPSSKNSGTLLRPFKPGEAVGITLVSGDVRLGGIGTVTYVKGNRAIIFAHPGMRMGNTPAPIFRAWITSFIPRLSNSFKQGFITSPAGVQSDEGLPGVVIDTSRAPHFLPLRIHVTKDGHARDYAFRLIESPTMSFYFIRGLVMYAFMQEVSGRGDVTASIDYTFTVRTPSGKRTWRFDDLLSTTNAMTMAFLYTPRGLNALRLFMKNPFLRVAIDSVDVHIKLNTGQLSSYRLIRLESPAPVLEAGQTYTFQAVFRPLLGDEIKVPFKIRMPALAQSAKLEINASSSVDTPLPVPPPRNYAQLERYLQRYLSPRTFIVWYRVPDPAVNVDGERLEHLPVSMVDMLTPISRGRQRLMQSREIFVSRLKVPLTGRAKVKVLVEVKQ